MIFKWLYKVLVLRKMSKSSFFFTACTARCFGGVGEVGIFCLSFTTVSFVSYSWRPKTQIYLLTKEQLFLSLLLTLTSDQSPLLPSAKLCTQRLRHNPKFMQLHIPLCVCSFCCVSRLGTVLWTLTPCGPMRRTVWGLCFGCARTRLTGERCWGFRAAGMFTRTRLFTNSCLFNNGCFCVEGHIWAICFS